MMSQNALSIYFWGVYLWFCAGAIIIGIPAIREFARMLRKK